MAEASGNKIRLIVVTPYKTFYDGMVSIITIPSTDGEIGIMSGHDPLVVALKPGICRINIDGEIKRFTSSEGYAEIGRHQALIVCNSAEWPEEISVARILKSYKDASGRMEDEKRQNKEDGVQITSDATNMLGRAKARIHLIELEGSEAQKSRLESHANDLTGD